MPRETTRLHRLSAKNQKNKIGEKNCFSHGLDRIKQFFVLFQRHCPQRTHKQFLLAAFHSNKYPSACANQCAAQERQRQQTAPAGCRQPLELFIRHSQNTAVLFLIRLTQLPIGGVALVAFCIRNLAICHTNGNGIVSFLISGRRLLFIQCKRTGQIWSFTIWNCLSIAEVVFLILF